jgi:lysophospholipase L1-like esterase
MAMNKISRILAFVLCLSMLVCLAACTQGNGNENTTPSVTTPSVTTPSDTASSDTAPVETTPTPDTEPAKPEREKMEYFKNYVSNTLAGTSNQLYFDNSSAKDKISEGMMFYKATVGGEFEYSLLFSNSIDSTYASGNKGVPNMKLADFEITGVKIGVLNGKQYPTPQNAESKTTLVSAAVSKYEHTNKVTYFETSPVKLNAKADDYIVVIVEFKGTRVPCHVESLIPTFKNENGTWKSSKNIPLANMVGIKREVKATVAYLGDSITQGIGVGEDKYVFWNAIASKKLGDDYAYWNLGIGYARCKDAATDGSWLFKAKQADYVVVCLGVNDISSDKATGTQLCKNLKTVVDKLNAAGCNVILQTVPPYTSYNDDGIKTWYAANDYIRNELSKKVVAVFDQTELLMTAEKKPNKVRYGGHPSQLGCKRWGEALYKFLTENVEEFKVN